MSVERTRQGIPTGKFDLAHLKAIHRHLFQDIYDWAGEIRTVEINKGGSQFQFRRFIGQGMSDVHSRLVAAKFGRKLKPDAFAALAGEIMGDVNYCHPFREGNGRTQLQYLKQLGAQAVHPVNLTKLDQASWIHASREAHNGRYDAMAAAIRVCL